MRTYIALFRGINVGGKNIILMKDLAHLMEENKCQNVKTYIQSGNVVFQSKKQPGTVISSMIESKYGFKPEVLILNVPEFLLAVENNPYDRVEGKTSHFYFCKAVPKINSEKLEALRSQSESYNVIGKVFYLHAPDGIGRSKLAANVEVCLGVPATARNLNTINKLLKMLQNA